MGLSDIRNLVLPHSWTPLWSYTPRCICSWFSEGRGIGQRVILLKTIKGILRERQVEVDRERREGEVDRKKSVGDDTERKCAKRDGELNSRQEEI